MAKNEKLGIGIAVIALSALMALLSIAGSRPAHAGGQSIRCSDSIGAVSSTSPFYQNGCAAAATTTPVYFGNGVTGAATTTMTQVYDPLATGYDVNLDTIASTTGSIVWWQASYSEDGTNWYPETSSSSGVATPLYHSWTPGATSAKRINVRTSSAGAKYFELQVWSSVASSSVYAQLVTTDATPN